MGFTVSFILTINVFVPQSVGGAAQARIEEPNTSSDEAAAGVCEISVAAMPLGQIGDEQIN